ncbi:cupin domain-containing protein [Kribbella sp. NBC_00709]|uniref:helix-turn-helix domain-containing protein n=1 Tax=Kribbella sp. NBC_00709 TaxID=2975972 RepID=UPI002E2DD63D|nr:cupin domain-containing protein [Kribbella sp. NBC_00709]
MTLRARKRGDAEPPADTVDESTAVGATIRRLRRAREMSAAELAQAAELSPGAISQIESGTTQPSLPALRRIARGLRVPVFQLLLEDEKPNGHVVRRSEAGPRGRGQIAYDVLTPDTDGELEVIEVRLAPGQSTADRPVSHPGEECLVVVEGDVTVEIGAETYDLARRDAVTFRGERPHRVINSGVGDALAISIVTRSPRAAD